ncbi:MAG: formate dehydrogenase accessory sulfurtransferase FdhD [Chloroflexota bacterium]|nr:formate dehydrogenase accessory sulfurtransferase FdhD [Chloroflexota bacterium]
MEPGDSVEHPIGTASGAGYTAEPAAAPLSVRQPVWRWVSNSSTLTCDDLTIEEPLQIRMAGVDVAVTMRTPGHDEELAAGFLFSEGLIEGRHQLDSIARCPAEDGTPSPNILNVQPAERDLVNPHSWGRDFLATSSCGLCGKTSLGQVERARERLRPLSHDFTVPVDTLYSLPDKLRDRQSTFARTGGIHAAGLFDLQGNLLLLREDVGRHNAVDKIVGYALLNDLLPLDRHVLLVSSRASFEIVQKALTAGISLMCAISAPSSLAVELARRSEMTLVAFLRQARLNVYSGPERLQKP